jgi:hypothetical protein
MSELENNIVTWLTGKPTLADVSVSQLENIVSQYPYFTIAQLLLTAKLKEENHAGYERQLQKTALNFQDPKWLFFQLNQLTDYKKADKDLSNISMESIENEIVETHIPANLEIIETFNNDENDNFNLGENVPEKDIQAEKKKVKAFLKSVIDSPHVQFEEKNTELTTPETEISEKLETSEKFNQVEIAKEETFTEAIDEYIAEKEQPSEAIVAEVENPENATIENIETTESQPIISNEEKIEVEEELHPQTLEISNKSESPLETFEENIAENEELKEPITGEHEIAPKISESKFSEEIQEEHIEVEEAQHPEVIEFSDDSKDNIEHIEANISDENIEEEQTPIPKEEILPIVDDSNLPSEDISEVESEEDIEETNTAETEEENLIGEKLSAKLANIASTFKSESVPQQPLISEETTPAHLKDYFASIGVKVDNTIQTDFGQKVKKFTDWLKVMKKIGSNGALIQTSENEERQVAQDAAKSNQNSDIVTEAMVDVLMKQGKKNEAIEILNRLSLLKPEKSAYFASQINDLNENK